MICLFHSLDIVLYREENFNFNDVQFINNFLHGSCLGVKSKMSSPCPRSSSFFAMLFSRGLVLHFTLA